MRIIIEIARVTFKGGVRDKVFITLLIVSVFCFIFLVPTVSSLSMRQVREVAVGLSLSVISFVSLILTTFLGVLLVYRDVERRFAHSIISMPVSRESYIIGKFLGLSAIIGSTVIVLSLFSIAGISIASGLSKATVPMSWENYAAAVFFEFMLLIVMAALSILFSSFSTNIFIPLFATLGFFLVGTVTQTVMDYIQSSYGKTLPVASVLLSKVAYYLFPNLSALDLKFNAIYGLAVSPLYLITTFSYAFLYIVIVLSLSLLIFRQRELL